MAKSTAAPEQKKTECPVTREQFRESAPATITVTLPSGQKVICNKKEFSTDSLGWNCNDKMVVEIDGVACKVQVGINLTLVGSKELPK